jgi:hypothetical protein
MVKMAIVCTLVFAATVHASDNLFSKEAVNAAGKDQVTAPDGKTRVVLGSVLKRGESHLLLSFNVGGKGSTRFDVGRGTGAELLWSPDSKALAVTTSNGSSNGVFDLFIFQIEGATVRKIDATQSVRKVFGHPVACAYPEPPNVVAVAWTQSSAHLLVAAQILDHSVCDSFGTFKLYELSVPSLMVDKTYDQLEAKRLFGSKLGVFLQRARDICISDPRVCEVPANHKAGAQAVTPSS